MEVYPGIHQIQRVSNSYLVVDEDIMLVDTGLPGNSSKIIDYVQNTLKRDPHDIKTIILTHHHLDHVGSVEKLKKITGASVAAHKLDAGYINGTKSRPGPFLLRTATNIMKMVSRTKPVKPDILLKDGDVIKGYQVIHTPGHTPGSICLYNPENRVIFVGDNFRRSKDGNIEGPVPKYTPDMDLAKNSIKKLGDLNIDVILTGHNLPLTPDASSKLKEYLKTI
jgi:hydroxyacylglutathione hydrolase